MNYVDDGLVSNIEQVVSSIKVSDLIKKLQNYDENDKVELVIWGCSDVPSTILKVKDDILLRDDY